MMPGLKSAMTPMAQEINFRQNYSINLRRNTALSKQVLLICPYHFIFFYTN